MGCCFSTPNSNQTQNEPQHPQPHRGSLQQNCRTRIPQPLEEEYVKEVLSETPISKLQQIPTFKPQMKTQLPVMQPPEVPVKKALEPEEVSLVSETCSNGESFSTTTTATTTVTEIREDEATSKRSNATRNRKRSYAVDGNRISSRERRQKSPARKPEIPVRSRPVPRRESDQVRRLSGGGSIRRSRSPSRGGRSNIRPPTRQVPVTKDAVQRNEGVSVKESLENPHVSLECFIFL
ncbi:muscle M-line assembly protein unc-89-like [Vigna umbellata]|uniref:muscle M-line assembly protein unc-89-like n=1 Tax=Vigna umbellata TaxID=87088 RepID=UPI001F5F8F01|nr:muscle M-line assembly protein unc-89-like [Vigna umbellata]